MIDFVNGALFFFSEHIQVVFLEHTSCLGGWVVFIPSQWPTLKSGFSCFIK